MILGLGRYPGEGIGYPHKYSWASLVAQTLRNPPAMWGDLDSIPGLERSPVGEHGNPLQYSCLENPHGQKSQRATAHGVAKKATAHWVAKRATAHGVAKSQAWLSDKAQHSAD